MNIFIVSEHLDSLEEGKDRLFRLGRELSSRGHAVTVLTGNQSVGMDLGRKNIGLSRKNGLNVIAFNIPSGGKPGLWQQALAGLKFARLAGRQGQNLPGPGLILAKCPPLTAALPAMKLSEYYRVPLVAEFRELWPWALVERGELSNGLIIKVLQGLEQKIYEKASRIIAPDQAVAERIQENLTERTKVRVVEDKGDSHLLGKEYDRALSGLGLAAADPAKAGSEQ